MTGAHARAPASAPAPAWDVIIVGAGPAGCALALRLRPALRVLLLERRQAPGDDTARIGESLPGAAGSLLRRLGLHDHFIAQGHAARGATVSQWHTDQATWFDAVRDPQGAGWHLDRRRFDQGLRGAALAAGVTINDDFRRVTVAREAAHWGVALHAGPGRPDTAPQCHRASVLVDASGTRMVAARQLGIERHGQDRLVCLYAHLPATGRGEDDDDQVTRICADSNGWWYSVRVPSGQRVLAFHLDSDDAELASLRAPARLLAKCRRHRLLEVVAPAAMDFTVRVQPACGGAIAPAALARLPPGFFAIGDAMLSFDPIASQGIFNALASADSAAQAIGRYLGGVDDARAHYLEEARAVGIRYRERLRETYGAVTRFGGERFWERRAA